MVLLNILIINCIISGSINFLRRLLKSIKFHSILKTEKANTGGRMAKKSKTLKPDTILKNYWRNNEQFADLFNAVLFQGEPVIRPEELEDADTEESGIFEHRDYAESIQASRDNIKICKKSLFHNIGFVLLGKEAQEHIHYAMPMRIMGYDYGNYKKQYDSNARKYTTAAGLEEDEYLSRFTMAKDPGTGLFPSMTCLIFPVVWRNS